MRLIIAQPTNLEAADTSFEVDLTEEQDQQFAEALYQSKGEIVMSLEDEAGARLGVRGVLYDSEM